MPPWCFELFRKGADVTNRTTVTNPSEEDLGQCPRGELIGFAIDGGPIVRFTSSQTDNFSTNGEILGLCQIGRPIVVYRKNSIRFITDDDDFKEKMADSDDTTAVGDQSPV